MKSKQRGMYMSPLFTVPSDKRAKTTKVAGGRLKTK